MSYIKIVLNGIFQLMPFLMIVFVAVVIAALVLVQLNNKSDTFVSKIKLPFIEIHFNEKANKKKQQNKKK